MSASRFILVAGAFLVVLGVFLVVIGILYGTEVCFCPPGIVNCCRGEGVLGLASYLIQTWGISATSIGIALSLLGLAVLEVGRKGRLGLLSAGGSLSVLSAVLLSPMAISSFGYAINYGNPLLPLAAGLFTSLAIVAGCAGASFAYRRIHYLWIILGLMLEISAALLGAFAIYPFAEFLVLPIIAMSFFSLLFLSIERYLCPSSKTPTSTGRNWSA